MTVLESPFFPSLVYLALVFGVWTAALALVSPGTGVYEGLAFLALALAGLGMLVVPINVWSVVVLLLGALLFGFSLWRRREGLWLALSAVALTVGSAFLFRGEAGGPAVSPVLTSVVSLLTIAYFWLAIRKALTAAGIRPTIDPSLLIGQIGEVRTAIDLTGSVYVGGELWSARADVPIRVGAKVRVSDRDGLILLVEPVEQA